MINLNDIKTAINDNRVYVTNHAAIEMRNDGLKLAEIFFGADNGEIIKQYEDDKPFPSCLMLGYTEDEQVFHSVWAFDRIKKGVVLITVYKPDPEIWESDFKTKKGQI